MGCILSKKNKSHIPDLASYESTIQHHRSLLSFDTILRERTTLAIESVVNYSSPSPSLSLDSLRHVTRSLADINEQVVEYILQSNEDIRNNPDLLDLIQDYFSSSSQVLSFYSDLEKYVTKIRNNHLFVQLAIARFGEEKTEPGSEFSKTLRELENFKSAGDPFTEEFFALFVPVYDQQVLMLSKLRAKREKLNRKLKGLRLYKKVSNVLFAAAFAAVVICSVVLAVIVTPAGTAALLMAGTAPLGMVGTWMRSLWRGYEDTIKKELDHVLKMEIESLIAVAELQNIQRLVQDLKVKIEAMLFKAEVAVERDDEVAVSLVIDEIKKSLAGFTQAVDDLGEQSDKYRRDIRRAREEVLQIFKN